MAAQGGLLAGKAVVDLVGAVLPKARNAHRQRVSETDAIGAFDIGGLQRAVGAVQVIGLLLGRFGGGEGDDAGGGVAALQRALRTTGDFDIGQVGERLALEHDIFHHRVVHDDRDRLAGGKVEVGIVQAVDIEARRDAAVGGFRVEAGNMVGDRLHVLARLEDHAQALARQRRCLNRDVLLVLGAAIDRHHDGLQLLRHGALRQRNEGGATHQDGGALAESLRSHRGYPMRIFEPAEMPSSIKNPQAPVARFWARLCYGLNVAMRRFGVNENCCAAT